MPIYDTQHGRHQADSEDIIGICKETNAGDDDGTNVIPAERSLVYLRQSQSSALVGVGDMSVIIVEVVKGSIASGRLCGHCQVADSIDQANDCLMSRRKGLALKVMTKRAREESAVREEGSFFLIHGATFWAVVGSMHKVAIREPILYQMNALA